MFLSQMRASVHDRLRDEDQIEVERLVRVVLPSGEVRHCEGEMDAERVVRIVLPCGTVMDLPQPMPLEGP